ncbi:MAG: DUF4197 domain-containing protein [Bacteroidales bacterium]|nr:DUF4197 domain-containing protein [Bacteroidales bacterium]MBN2761770.1 DUF4197 domain-containing protein [Bacteroidales bacterium]
MKKVLLSIGVIALMVAGCEWLEDNVPEGLTEEEIIEGLKTALNVGSDSASGNLSLTDGYYGNALVKIPLPPEVVSLRNAINGNSTLALISSTIGLEDKFEDVILAVNRSAENAAKEAAPIFKNAITGLTIAQGWDILHGVVPSQTKSTSIEDFDSTAATKYLSQQTYDPLTNLYAPKINASLDKDLVGNYSATELWNDVTTTYNSFLSRTDVQTALTLAEMMGQSLNLPASINTDLGEFSTQKALNGLFLMVGKEEIKIRRDPLAWAKTAVGNILEKVFGSVE